MNIILQCPTMARGGTWFRCEGLARGLSALGHEVTVVKAAGDRRLLPRLSREHGFTLLETPRAVGSRFSHGNTRLPSDLMTRFIHALRHADVVHSFSHHLNAVAPALWARASRRARLCVMDWDDLWTDGGIYGSRPAGLSLKRLNWEVDAFSERVFKTWADAVTVVSDELWNRSLADGVPAERMLRVPNGVSLDVTEGDRAEARRRLGIDPVTPVTIFVGFGQYDLDMVLDAHALLTQGGVKPLLLVAGPHPEHARALAAERGVADSVRAPGLLSMPEMTTWLQAADVGLLPFADKPLNRARWPIKLGDYIAAGLPVVTNAVGEMGRVVGELGLGSVAAPDAAAFAREIRTVLGRERGRWEEPMRRARDTLSWTRIAADLAEAYVRWSRA